MKTPWVSFVVSLGAIRASAHRVHTVEESLSVGGTAQLKHSRSRKQDFTVAQQGAGELKDFAFTFAGLAYTLAPGNYNYAKASIPKGWSLIDQVNEKSGPHIFSFKHVQSGGIVVAIRGTDLPSRPKHTCGPGCQSDLKADWELFDQSFIGPERDLDGSGERYIEAAISMVSRAKAIKSGAVLVTGHSLGAGLAVIAGARVGGVAVRAFSAPPFARHLPSKKAAAGMELIYARNDPVYLATKVRGGFGGASPCAFASSVVYPGCDTCGRQTVSGGAAALIGTVWADTRECTQCWPKAHFLSNYKNVGSC